MTKFLLSIACLVAFLSLPTSAQDLEKRKVSKPATADPIRVLKLKVPTGGFTTIPLQMFGNDYGLERMPMNKPKIHEALLALNSGNNDGAIKASREFLNSNPDAYGDDIEKASYILASALAKKNKFPTAISVLESGMLKGGNVGNTTHLCANLLVALRKGKLPTEQWSTSYSTGVLKPAKATTKPASAK